MPATISYILVMKHVPAPACTNNLCLKNGNWKEFIELPLMRTYFSSSYYFLAAIFSKEIVPKYKRKNLTLSIFEISLTKSCQNGFLPFDIKKSDRYGSIDTHIATFYDIYDKW